MHARLHVTADSGGGDEVDCEKGLSTGPWVVSVHSGTSQQAQQVCSIPGLPGQRPATCTQALE